MKYDIFISYRRKDSSGRSNVPTARQFKLAFEAPPYNYKVFFDYSECTDNYFSDTILPAIRTCDFFVLVLTKDCLARCVNEGDWVRREIEEAIASNRKIIPITPDKECETFPSDLPDSLRKTFKDLQITTVYTDHMFESSIVFLVKNRFHLNKALTDSETDRKVKEEAEREKLEREQKTKQTNGHEYVDLGLPSGTLWATCNVGASKPEDFGDYFSWDEGKKATANMSNGWSMPSEEQWAELMENTKSIWTTRNGVNGRMFTAHNGNSLFLPAAGKRGSSVEYENSDGYYWSVSPSSNAYAYDMWFNCSYFEPRYGSHRFYLRSVRLVRSASQN